MNEGTASDDFFEVVSTARSVRRRLDYDRPVEPEVIERCIADFEGVESVDGLKCVFKRALSRA